MPLEASFRLDLWQWLKENYLSKLDILFNGIPWKTLFTFTIWALWKHRNRVVFENTTLNPNLHKTSTRQAIDYFYCIGKSLRTKRVGTLQFAGSVD